MGKRLLRDSKGRFRTRTNPSRQRRGIRHDMRRQDRRIAELVRGMKRTDPGLYAKLKRSRSARRKDGPWPR